jgi:hypothetical protein
VGNLIPQSNVTIFLNTNVTSRIVSSTASEALLTIDEPFPPTGTQVPTTAQPGPGVPQTQSGCLTNQFVSGTTFGACQMYGVTTSGGVNTLSPGNPSTGNAGPYRGVAYTSGTVSSNSYNIFQGLQTGVNSISWNGVPIDAPGSAGVRTIRITNVRGNACQLGTSSTLIPSQIIMVISITGSQAISVNNPTQIVATVLTGLVPGNKTGSFLQCNTTNGNLLGLSNPGVVAAPISLTATEGFANAFKVRNYSQVASAPTSNTTSGFPNANAANGVQNVLGTLFYIDTESGIILPSSTPGTLVGTGTTPGSIGVADSGTQITFGFAAIGSGVNLFVPQAINLVQAGTSTVTGLAVLVSGVGANGITISGTTASITYEVVYSNPNVIESLSVPLSVAFISNTANNLPAAGTSTLAINFSPLSTVTTASAEPVPIPRFCQPRTPGNVFTVGLCTCNLLFPFVTNQVGFDTGIAIANTSLDPFGTTPQAGTITLFFAGNTTGGGAAPGNVVTPSIAAGAEYVTNLSTIAPGFQGYMIATARFQYCHGFAFISDIGATKLAEGYLAIQLDFPFNLLNTNRTGVAGENEGH